MVTPPTSSATSTLTTATAITAATATATDTASDSSSSVIPPAASSSFRLPPAAVSQDPRDLIAATRDWLDATHPITTIPASPASSPSSSASSSPRFSGKRSPSGDHPSVGGKFPRLPGETPEQHEARVNARMRELERIWEEANDEYDDDEDDDDDDESEDDDDDAPVPIGERVIAPRGRPYRRAPPSLLSLFGISSSAATPAVVPTASSIPSLLVAATSPPQSAAVAEDEVDEKDDNDNEEEKGEEGEAEEEEEEEEEDEDGEEEGDDEEDNDEEDNEENDDDDGEVEQAPSHSLYIFFCRFFFSYIFSPSIYLFERSSVLPLQFLKFCLAVFGIVKMVLNHQGSSVLRAIASRSAGDGCWWHWICSKVVLGFGWGRAKGGGTLVLLCGSDWAYGATVSNPMGTCKVIWKTRNTHFKNYYKQCMD
ncbi:hypothetical protein BDA99DRAFT_538091 [Phascolomyces articulosus]|uniref:Uncharacterized protein n=1 Tax=Phascolomyces articulosus TaxID=60185 RepID=A0AAD5K7U2_9FUNG|nr:hypothetical protein BDA99DRAFT_538091 [Phascolomyces articulosus]